MSRRAVFGTGAGIVAVAGAAILGDRAHKLDDLARTIGLQPRRLPAHSDEALIRGAQRDQSVLLVWTRAAADREPILTKTLAPLIANAEAQLFGLGGAVDGIKISTPPASARGWLDVVITMHRRAAAKRTKESLHAVSGDFAQVLASISVSLEQSLVVLRNARKELA